MSVEPNVLTRSRAFKFGDEEAGGSGPINDALGVSGDFVDASVIDAPRDAGGSGPAEDNDDVGFNVDVVDAPETTDDPRGGEREEVEEAGGSGPANDALDAANAAAPRGEASGLIDKRRGGRLLGSGAVRGGGGSGPASTGETERGSRSADERRPPAEEPRAAACAAAAPLIASSSPIALSEGRRERSLFCVLSLEIKCRCLTPLRSMVVARNVVRLLSSAASPNTSAQVPP